jgi:hypothetical protein
MKEFSDKETWNECFEKICEIVKPFDRDPNFDSDVFYVHNVPKEEAVENETRDNVFSKLDELRKKEPYSNVIGSIRYSFGFTGFPFGKGEIASIEIRRK